MRFAHGVGDFLSRIGGLSLGMGSRPLDFVIVREKMNDVFEDERADNGDCNHKDQHGLIFPEPEAGEPMEPARFDVEASKALLI